MRFLNWAIIGFWWPWLDFRQCYKRNAIIIIEGVTLLLRPFPIFLQLTDPKAIHCIFSDSLRSKAGKIVPFFFALPNCVAWFMTKKSYLWPFFQISKMFWNFSFYTFISFDWSNGMCYFCLRIEFYKGNLWLILNIKMGAPAIKHKLHYLEVAETCISQGRPEKDNSLIMYKKKSE